MNIKEYRETIAGAKYKNQKSNGYHSKKESNRAFELKMLEKSGKIKYLKEQVPYELIPSQRGVNRNERPCKYIADFTYYEDGNLIVEDCKGFRTKDYIIKRKLMLKIFGISIRET